MCIPHQNPMALAPIANPNDNAASNFSVGGAARPVLQGRLALKAGSDAQAAAAQAAKPAPTPPPASPLVNVGGFAVGTSPDGAAGTFNRSDNDAFRLGAL